MSSESAHPGHLCWVEPHEESALISLGLVEALRVLSLIVLWMGRGNPTFPRGVLGLTLVAAGIAAGSLAWTANLG